MNVTVLGSVVVVSLMTCAINEGRGLYGEEVVPQKTIEVVLRENNPELLSLPGVVGTAESLCSGRPCIKIYVTRKTSDVVRTIPKVLEGYPVMIEETGEIKALQKPAAEH